MNTLAPMRDRTTRAEALCETLEAMIVDGLLAPGARLEETELAQQFEVSRTPVREAIRALVAIGLVEANGRQGTIVMPVSIAMLIEMFELMAVLEGMCAELAARRATDAERAKMHETHKDLQSAFEARNPNTFYHVNLAFHDQIYAAAHTQFLAGQTLRLRRRLSPYRMRVTYQPGRMQASIDEHASILAAIDQGAGDQAKSAAESHVRLLGKQLEDFIASLPDSLRAHR